MAEELRDEGGSVGNETALASLSNKILVDGKHLEIIKTLTEQEALEAFATIGHIFGKGMVYVGDLAVELEDNGKITFKSGPGNWNDFYDEAAERSNLKRTTIQDAKTIMARVNSANRFAELGIRHYALVARMDDKTQHKLLSECVDGHWSTKRLKQEVQKLLPEPPPPEGKYSVIYADPPWAYDTAESTKEVSDHYRTMELEELIAFGKRVKPIADTNCVLYMWAQYSRMLNSERNSRKKERH